MPKDPSRVVTWSLYWIYSDDSNPWWLVHEMARRENENMAPRFWKEWHSAEKPRQHSRHLVAPSPSIERNAMALLPAWLHPRGAQPCMPSEKKWNRSCGRARIGYGRLGGQTSSKGRSGKRRSKTNFKKTFSFFFSTFPSFHPSLFLHALLWIRPHLLIHTSITERSHQLPTKTLLIHIVETNIVLVRKRTINTHKVFPFYWVLIFSVLAGSNSSEQDVLHSRTVSDSSASRLATNGVPHGQIEPSSDYSDDPYAKPRIYPTQPNNTNTTHTDRHGTIPRTSNDSYHRANSYLPYSHHTRDPAQSITPIYVEEERQQTHQGSMLHENFTMDMTNDPRIEHGNKEKCSAMDDLLRQQQEQLDQPKDKRLRFWLQQRWLWGVARWVWFLLLIAFIVTFTLLMYFLIPRMPTVNITDTETYQYPSWSKDKSTMTADWNVNVALDNSINWIPTLLQRMEVAVEDLDTKVAIGSGFITDSQWLASRDNNILIKLPVHIAYSGTNTSDDTISDLITICGLERQPVGPSYGSASELFNVTFHIDLHVRGIPWSSRTTVIPERGIQCPS